MHILYYLNLFFIVFGVFYLVLFKKYYALSILVGIFLSVDALGSQWVVNFGAIKILGLILIPFCIKKISFSHLNFVTKINFIQFFYLASIGTLYVFLDMWNDEGFKLQHSMKMRPILNLGSSVLLYTPIFFFTLLASRKELSIKRTIRGFIQGFYIGSIFLMLGIVAEILFSLDLYSLLTRGVQMLNEYRPRGLSYEPRGASQTLVCAILLLLYSEIKAFYKALLYLILILSAFYLTFSFTGFILLLVGVIISLLYKSLLLFKNRIKFEVFCNEFFVIAVTYFVIFSPPAFLAKKVPNDSTKMQQAEHIKQRSYVFGNNVSYDLSSLKQDKSVIGRIVRKLEIFDAASLNFMLNNPVFIAFGSGPGMVSIPASNYILERDKKLYKVDKITSIPQMGIFSILGDGGLVYLSLWLVILMHLRKKIFELLTRDHQGFYLLVCFSSLYLLQARNFWYFHILVLLQMAINEEEVDNCGVGKAIS